MVRFNSKCVWDESLPISVLPNKMISALTTGRYMFAEMGEDERLRCDDRMMFKAEVQRRLSLCTSQEDILSTTLAIKDGMASYTVTMNRLDLFVKHVHGDNVCAALSLMARALPTGGEELSEAVDARVSMLEHVKKSKLICVESHRECFRDLLEEVERHGSIELFDAVCRVCECTVYSALCELSLTCKKHGEVGMDFLLNNKYGRVKWDDRLILDAVITEKYDLVRKLTSERMIPLANYGHLVREAGKMSIVMLLPVVRMVRRLGQWDDIATAQSLAGALFKHLLDAGCLPVTYVDHMRESTCPPTRAYTGERGSSSSCT